MYGLFEITFDYYSWETLIAVSAVKDNLILYHERGYDDNAAKNYPLYNVEKSDEIIEGRTEEFHFVIKEVLEI